MFLPRLAHRLARTRLRRLTITSHHVGGSSRHMSSTDDEDRLPENCPFEPGATLKLQLHDIGDDMHRDAGSSFEVQVLRPFLPLSNGQALHVRPTAPHPHLPSNLLVKLFDRRFMDRYWVSENSSSPASELAARTAWRHIEEGAAEDPKVLDDALFVPEDPWLREKLPWLRMTETFVMECEAYRLLAPLQGTAIPKLFGTLSWRDPQLDAFVSASHPIFAATPGLAIEFIEGSTLRDVAERKTAKDCPTDAEERMSAKVLDIAHALGKYGVIHGDIRPFNIMLRSHSLEPVLIDFGRVVLRREHETEDEWTERLRKAEQIHQFRRMLWHARVHDPAPDPGSVIEVPFLGYLFLNDAAEAIRAPTKRLEWFEPVPCEEPGYKTVLNDDGVEVRYELQRWRIRPGVRVRPNDEY